MTTLKEAVNEIGKQFLPNDDLEAIWKQVEDNILRLNNCVAPHDFQSTDNRALAPDYQCTKCGGKVSKSDYHWYQKGLEHGKR